MPILAYLNSNSFVELILRISDLLIAIELNEIKFKIINNEQGIHAFLDQISSAVLKYDNIFIYYYDSTDNLIILCFDVGER